MKRSHLWRFLLSIATFWIAFAVPSLAQSHPVTALPGSSSSTWSSACTGSASYYQCTSSTCNLVVDSSNGTAVVYPSGSPSQTFTTLCLSISNNSSVTVQWAGKAAGAGFVLQFGDSDPFSSPTPPVLPSSFVAGGSIPSSSGSLGDGKCYDYTIAYCPPNADCVTADPQVVVRCTSPLADVCPAGKRGK